MRFAIKWIISINSFFSRFEGIGSSGAFLLLLLRSDYVTISVVLLWKRTECRFIFANHAKPLTFYANVHSLNIELWKLWSHLMVMVKMGKMLRETVLDQPMRREEKNRKCSIPFNGILMHFISIFMVKWAFILDIQCGDVDDDLWPCMAFHHFPQLIRTYRLFRMLYPRWNVVYLEIDANFQPKLVLSQVNVNKRIE